MKTIELSGHSTSLHGSGDFQAHLENLLTVGHISVTNAKGKIIYCNQNFAEINKMTIEDVVGNNHRIFKSGHHNEETFVKLWKTISSSNVWSGVLVNEASDRSLYETYTVIIPVTISKNRPEFYIALRVDSKDSAAIKELNQITKNSHVLSDENQAILATLVEKLAHAK